MKWLGKCIMTSQRGHGMNLYLLHINPIIQRKIAAIPCHWSKYGGVNIARHTSDTVGQEHCMRFSVVEAGVGFTAADWTVGLMSHIVKQNHKDLLSYSIREMIRTYMMQWICFIFSDHCPVRRPLYAGALSCFDTNGCWRFPRIFSVNV